MHPIIWCISIWIPTLEKPAHNVSLNFHFFAYIYFEQEMCKISKSETLNATIFDNAQNEVSLADAKSNVRYLSITRRYQSCKLSKQLKEQPWRKAIAKLVSKHVNHVWHSWLPNARVSSWVGSTSFPKPESLPMIFPRLLYHIRCSYNVLLVHS